jgi:hypothetical protein
MLAGQQAKAAARGDAHLMQILRELPMACRSRSVRPSARRYASSCCAIRCRSVAAGDVPKFVTEHQPVPAATNPPGTKGCARGRLGRCLVIVPNANIDALSDYGIRHIAMPVTSEKVWRAIHAARAGIGVCKIG